MSGGSTQRVDDGANALKIKQLEIDEQRRQQAAADAKEMQRLARVAAGRNAARSAGAQAANDYFTARGVEPTNYGSDIDRAITQALASVDPNDETPSVDVGGEVYNRKRDARRMEQQRLFSTMLPTDFERTRIRDDMDDPILSAIEAEQRSTADDFIRRMLERGVITSSGYNAARGDLDRQAYGAKARLNEIGTNALEGGRTNLREIANRGRTRIANLDLGDAFDANEFATEADRSLTEFLNNLGSNIRSKAPGQLFSTTGLTAIAGAGQGAQNTKFVPNSRLFEDDNEDEDQRVNETSEAF